MVGPCTDRRSRLLGCAEIRLFIGVLRERLGPSSAKFAMMPGTDVPDKAVNLCRDSKEREGGRGRGVSDNE